MYLTRIRCCLFLSLAAACVMMLAPTSAWAQIGGGGLGGGIGGGGGGVGVGGNFQNAGVVVDASGVLRVKMFTDPSRRVGMERYKAAMAALKPELTKPTVMRKISLNRLEKAVAEQVAKGEALTDEMKYLAGLLRIQYVFYYPESQDIVIAGPAEGFREDLSGRDAWINHRSFRVGTAGFDRCPAGLPAQRQ